MRDAWRFSRIKAMAFSHIVYSAVLLMATMTLVAAAITTAVI